MGVLVDQIDRLRGHFTARSAHVLQAVLDVAGRRGPVERADMIGRSHALRELPKFWTQNHLAQFRLFHQGCGLF